MANYYVGANCVYLPNMFNSYKLFLLLPFKNNIIIKKVFYFGRMLFKNNCKSKFI